MIGEDAVADAECMKAVALGGEVLLLCRYARVSHQNSFISSRWRCHPPQSRPRLAARWRVGLRHARFGVDPWESSIQ